MIPRFLFSRTTMRIFCMLLLCGILFCSLSGCGASARDASFMDGSAVSFSPTVYYARDGRIRFLYDSASDMLSALEGYDMAAIYAGNLYSMVFSYQEGALSRADADASVKAEFNMGDDMVLSSGTKSVEVDGYSFRRTEITCSDGSRGAVLYGSTQTGFAEIYYLLSPDAGDDVRVHVEEILSTVRLTEFEGDSDDEQKVFVE